MKLRRFQMSKKNSRVGRKIPNKQTNNGGNSREIWKCWDTCTCVWCKQNKDIHVHTKIHRNTLPRILTFITIFSIYVILWAFLTSKSCEICLGYNTEKQNLNHKLYILKYKWWNDWYMERERERERERAFTSHSHSPLPVIVSLQVPLSLQIPQLNFGHSARRKS